MAVNDLVGSNENLLVGLHRAKGGGVKGGDVGGAEDGGGESAQDAHFGDGKGAVALRGGSAKERGRAGVADAGELEGDDVSGIGDDYPAKSSEAGSEVSGVRLSSGAATTKRADASEFTTSPVVSNIAAPAEGCVRPPHSAAITDLLSVRTAPKPPSA